MKQFNKSSEVEMTNPKKMEKLLKWTQEDLDIKSFSKTQKQMIHNVMTLADCLQRKNKSYNSAAAKSFKSEKIQIIYNFNTETMEFSCSSRAALINEKNLSVKPFNIELVESQVERIHLLTINLESLLQRMSCSEVNEIFMEKERNDQNRYYCERRDLAFKNKAGFDKLLDLIVQKIKRSFKKSYLSFMRSEFCENIPLYFSQAQLDHYARMKLYQSESFYSGDTGVTFVADKLFYQFVENNKELEPLKVYSENFLNDAILNKSYHLSGQDVEEVGIIIPEIKFKQLFSVLGPQKSLELIKTRLNPFFDNLSDENFFNLAETIENLFNSIATMSRFDKSFKVKDFEEFYLFFSQKLKALQSIEGKGDRMFMLNKINIDYFVNNIKEPFTVNFALSGYWDEKLENLLKNGFTVKTNIFRDPDESFRSAFYSITELQGIIVKSQKNNFPGTVLVSKNEFDAIKSLKNLWIETKPELQKSLDYFELRNKFF
jgi:hypothetical protein